MAQARPRLSRLTSGRWLAVTSGVLIVAALAGLALCLLALSRLADARVQVVDRVDPARVAAAQYVTAVLDEETGLRGYALTGRSEFLGPFQQGVAASRAARGRLRRIAAQGAIPELAADVDRIGVAVLGWRSGYADPAIAGVRGHGTRSASVPAAAMGKVLFDRVRRAGTIMEADLAAARAAGRIRLHDAARTAEIAVLFTGLLVLAAAFVASATLRRVVAAPLAHLARDVRRVAHGEFSHAVAQQGPRDVVELSADVDSMRRRILVDLEDVEEARRRLEAQALELQRSNADLEQFAYVASHDLQEPLRKVAGFCGLLQHRYRGQLDERADQYIDFAVDGAHQMQALINGLLEFSRVGHVDARHERVAMDDVASEALSNLAPAIAEAGATVTVDGPLPEVLGDRSLLVSLTQNLVGNAVKFRGAALPRVRVSARRDGAVFRFAVDDNGIGVEARFADRIFVIFQRLQTGEDYPGTGIGLAMARKIVEFHGGEIWLEPESADGGASFGFSLPVPDEHRAV
jgi:signal transduction histidine kinase